MDGARYRKGIAQGRQEGRKEGERALIVRLLTRRIGKLNLDLQARVQQLTVPQLEDLGEALLDFTSASELEEWLRQHQG